MKFTKGTGTMVISTLEDMVKLHNKNMHEATIELAKLCVKQRRTGRIAGLALIGVGALFKYTHDLATSHRQLKNDVTNLKEEYHHYVITHADYDSEEEFTDL